MTVTVARLVEGVVLSNAAASLYVSGAATKTLIKNLTVTNTSAGAQTVTVYLVPAGGAPNSASTLTYQRSVPAGATVQLTEAINHVLESGDSIWALASAASDLTLMASGAQIQ